MGIISIVRGVLLSYVNNSNFIRTAIYIVNTKTFENLLYLIENACLRISL